MSDHSWIHVQKVMNIALRLLRLLSRRGVEPVVVTEHGFTPKDAEVVVAAAALLHDTGMSIHRTDHEAYSLFLAARKLDRLLEDVYEEPARSILASEALHAIIGHRRRGEPLTLEAGIVRVADALDMERGPLARPVRGEPAEHPLAVGRRDRRRPDRRGRGPRDPDRDRDEQLRRHLPGGRAAGDQAARLRARGPRRGDRAHRRRAREAARADLQDLDWLGPGARSSVDRALASGARGRRFESCRAR